MATPPETDLQNLKRLIVRLDARLDDVQLNQVRVEEKNAGLAHAITGLSQKVMSLETTLAEKILDLEEKVSGLEQKVSSLRKQGEQQTHLETQIEAEIADLGVKLQEYRVGQGHFEEKIVDIGKQLDVTSTRVGILLTGFVTLLGILGTGILIVLGKLVLFPHNL